MQSANRNLAAVASIATPEFWRLANAWAGSTIDTEQRAAALVAFIDAECRRQAEGGDVVEIARLVCVEAWSFAQQDEVERARRPSPLGLLSPLVSAARLACLKRGMNASDLRLPPPVAVAAIK